MAGRNGAVPSAFGDCAATRRSGLALAWTDKAIAVNDGLAKSGIIGRWRLPSSSSIAEARSLFEPRDCLPADNWEGYYNLGRMLLIQKHFAEAEPAMRRASEIDPYSAPTWNNLGLVLHELYRYDEACVAYDQALDLVPDYVEAISNRASSLYYGRRFRKPKPLFRSALVLAPESGSVHYSLGSVLISGGNLKDGFQEHEWRWKVPSRPKIRTYNQPLWNGQPSNGETLLVWPEQGVGDTIQFIRIYSDLAKKTVNYRGNTECLYRLVKLLLACQRPVRSFRFPTFEFRSSSSAHEPSTNSRHSIRNASAIQTLFRPRGAEIDEWRRKLKSHDACGTPKEKRIGIVWAGSPSHPTDHNRSMAWETIAPVIDAHKKISIFQLHPNLIRTIRMSSISAANFAIMSVTAAIVANLDIVITVDTSIASSYRRIGKARMEHALLHARLAMENRRG